MGILRRLFMLLWTGLIVTMVVAAIGAMSARRRIVPPAKPEADEVELRAIFEPMHFQSRSTAFRGGTIECWYGGGVIDLREAVLDPAGAHLEIKTIFGGGQVITPDSWNVTTTVKGIGGVSDVRPRVERDVDGPHLTIDGMVLFGGFAVMSEVPEDELRGLDEQIRRWARHSTATGAPVEPTEPTTEPAS